MEELKGFTNSVMNLDKSDNNLLPNETREVHNYITDKEGCFTKLKGNTLVPFTLPAGENTVIGSCNDYSRHAILYFVKNSLGNHSILRFRGNKIDRVVWTQPVLNFVRDINHANVIGDLLYWTDGFFESFAVDGNNPPRKINFIRAIGGNYTFLSSYTYEKYDVVHWDSKVYEFIGDVPGVFPLSDKRNWELKGRKYDNLTQERLYWILDRIKYPLQAEAPVVYYTDNPPPEAPVITPPPLAIPWGNLYNWDALFMANAIELTFDSISNVPDGISDPENASQWNAFWDLPTYGTAFTSAVVVGNIVNLYGGENIHLKDNIFSSYGMGLGTHLSSIVDISGIIITAGEYCFAGNQIIVNMDLRGLTSAGEGCFSGWGVIEFESEKTFNLPMLETAGDYCFYSLMLQTSITLPALKNVGDYCFGALYSIQTLNISLCENLGATVGNDYVFYNTTGQTITITIPSALMTCNGGSPDADIDYLVANNTVTIVTV